MRVLRRLTFLLRPSWLILAVVVVAFAYLCFTVLAPWQLGKNGSTSHRNDLIAASVHADPVPADTLLATADGSAPAGTNPDNTEWRRVVATGSYVPNSTVVERLQQLDGAPAFGVLAAFRLDDGRTVLVDRGLISAVNGTQLPTIAEPPTGPQRIEGRLRHSQGVIPGKEPMVRGGIRQVYSVDIAQFSTVTGTPMTSFATGDRGGYMQLDAGQPGAFTPPPLPQLDAGPYLSYGLQWIAFGVMAPLGLGYFVFAELRERRRDRDTESNDTTADPAESSPVVESSEAQSPTTAEAEAPASAPPDPRAPATEAPAVDTGESPVGTTKKTSSTPRRTTTADRLADRYGSTRR